MIPSGPPSLDQPVFLSRFPALMTAGAALATLQKCPTENSSPKYQDYRRPALSLTRWGILRCMPVFSPGASQATCLLIGIHAAEKILIPSFLNWCIHYWFCLFCVLGFFFFFFSQQSSNLPVELNPVIKFQVWELDWLSELDFGPHQF